MIQPLNEGQCDAISASTRRKILRSTFNIDPEPRPPSSSASTSRGGGVAAMDEPVGARGALGHWAIGREVGPSSGPPNNSRELLEQTPLVATLLSWPMTLAMLSEHYLCSISDELDSNMVELVARGGGAGGHASRSGPGSFFQLLEPFYAKESKFRRCMHELLPHGSRAGAARATATAAASSGSSSARSSGLSDPGRTSGGFGFGEHSRPSGDSQSQKLLLRVRRGHEALRADVCEQLAELRRGFAEEVSSRGGGRPWLCRPLEDTKPWFVDGMGEGKGVVRALVAEFVAAVTPNLLAPTAAPQVGAETDADHGSQAQPLLVPCPADSAAESTSTWRRMVPAPAPAAAQQAASAEAEPIAAKGEGKQLAATSEAIGPEEGEPGSGPIAAAAATEAADQEEGQAAAVARSLRLEEYRSLGNIAGLCLLHGGEEFGLRLPCYLSRHVYKYLLGREVSFVDYAYYDPTEYEALSNLLAQTNAILAAADSQHSSARGGDAHAQAAAIKADQADPDAPLSGDGLLEWDESVGVVSVSGRPRPVTARNATAWCFAKARWEMVGKVEEELRAMRLGLHDVIPSSVLGGLALTADDLQMLLTGTGSPLSIHDWRSASLCSALLWPALLQCDAFPAVCLESVLLLPELTLLHCGCSCGAVRGPAFRWGACRRQYGQ
jgi:hypothetical protein